MSGVVHVPAGHPAPLDLFTPLGERVWADGWDPRFPDPGSAPDAAGSVFTVSHDGETTVWTILEHEPGRRIRYFRVRPGVHAGSLEVLLAGDASARVSYDLTALSHAGAVQNAHLQQHVQHMLDEWSVAIRASHEHGDSAER